MKKFRIIIAPIVQEQILGQVLHIAHDLPANALAWEARLRAAIDSIGRLPTRCAVDEEASARVGEQVRKMVFERTYLLFYRVVEEKRFIDILNFRHGARLPRRNEI